MEHNCLEKSVITAAENGHFFLMNYILDKHEFEVRGIEVELLPIIAKQGNIEVFKSVYKRMKDEL